MTPTPSTAHAIDATTPAPRRGVARSLPLNSTRAGHVFADMVIGRLSALTHQVLGQFKMACLLLGSYVVLGADRRRHEGLVVESVRREAI